jgi:hypothetical protein
MQATEAPAKTHWPIHPIALLFSPKPRQERAELKEDMRERVVRGLDPLESPLLLYQDMLLDGRHRDELWCELAVEGACDGFFTRNRPRTETFSRNTHGTLEAWLRAKSRNLAVRQTPAEQRGNTAEQVAALAGVGATTIKLLKKLQKDAPDQFEAVAQGRITAKKALKDVEQGKKGGAAVQQGEGKQGHDKGSEANKGLNETGQQPRKELQVGPGDPVYEVERVAGRPTIIQWEVRTVDRHSAMKSAVRSERVIVVGAKK